MLLTLSCKQLLQFFDFESPLSLSLKVFNLPLYCIDHFKEKARTRLSHPVAWLWGEFQGVLSRRIRFRMTQTRA